MAGPQGKTKAVLLIDFGSTWTKLTAVDPDREALLGTASAFTTVGEGVGVGLGRALAALEARTGPLEIAQRLACSSAAGGLRMVACGLAPALTAQAARLASLGAGAKVIKTFAHELTGEDVAEILAIRPYILLLCGGIDGGNRDCITHNARALGESDADFPVILAGNRSCAGECERLLAAKTVYRCENVLPALDTLNIGPAQAVIRGVFLERIVRAKGLSEERALLDGILMPTPAAVMAAMELLQAGCEVERGVGELVGVDLGGATTDVYSIAAGMPQGAGTVLKGLPEPFAKRTVEGDLGMRYSAAGVLDALGAQRLGALAGLAPDEAAGMVASLEQSPDRLPDDDRWRRLDFALAAGAVETAMGRHAGTIEEVYAPTGRIYAQTGKDLTGVETLLLTGGALIHAERVEEIAAHLLFDP